MWTREKEEQLEGLLKEKEKFLNKKRLIIETLYKIIFLVKNDVSVSFTIETLGGSGKLSLESDSSHSEAKKVTITYYDELGENCRK